MAGASEGLGAAFAEALAKRGMDLVLIARRREKLAALAERLKSDYAVDVRFHALDLSDIRKIKDVLAKEDPPVSLLVYNAAFAPVGAFTDISEADLSRVVDVNVRAPLLLTKYVSGHMIRKKHGAVILMSSLAGSQGTPRLAAYAASKAFNLILGESLWQELRERGIDVLVSQAGAISTPGYRRTQHAKKAAGTLDAATVAERTLRRLGKGPLTVPGITNKAVRFLMTRLLPRKTAISIMKHNTENLS